MRIPKYLSFSSFDLFRKDVREFYLRNLSPIRVPKQGQESFMAVGSAFDAVVKSYLLEACDMAKRDQAFQELFEAQVEPQNRDFALEAGNHVFECYQLSGAYDHLIEVLNKRVENPQIESTVTGTVEGIPLLGKPDVRFVVDMGEGPLHIILDYKVKGYCSKYSTSPSKGYMICRDGYSATKVSRSHGKEHQNYLGFSHRGLTINQGYMEFCKDEYADQLSMYGWLLGEQPGDENVVVWIEEILAKPALPKPLLRIATNRSRVSSKHQLKLLADLKHCWNAISNEHIFTTMSKEASLNECKHLDNVALALQIVEEGDEWHNEISRPAFRG